MTNGTGTSAGDGLPGADHRSIRIFAATGLAILPNATQWRTKEHRRKGYTMADLIAIGYLLSRTGPAREPLEDGQERPRVTPRVNR
jgi:hypothetical protein